MDQGVALLIGTLVGGFCGFIATKMQYQQKSDELLLIALENLGGGSQKRNVGISAIELYWNNSRHKDVCLSLLIGSGIYLLRDSEQDDKDIELYNLHRIMTFILKQGELRESLRNHYERLFEAVKEAENPKNKDSLKVKSKDLKDWQDELNRILK